MEVARRLRRKNGLSVGENSAENQEMIKWIICWREFCRKPRNDILTKKRITGTLDSNMGEFPSC